MTDEYLIENAQRLEDMVLQNSIEEIRQKSTIAIVPATGICMDCAEIFPETDPLREIRKFCDSSCEEGWHEWYQGQIRKHGPNYQPNITSTKRT